MTESPLIAELDRLASAKTSHELTSAHRAVTRAIEQRRAKLAATQGPLAQTYVALVAQWDAEKAAGVSREERIQHWEPVLRAAWPFKRAWKYACEDCGDYGLRMSECPGDATCGRAQPHLAHDFGTPCWCQAGRRYKPKARNEEDVVATAAKARKPMTRFGR